jgi:cell division septum initiation protein DivIVA
MTSNEYDLIKENESLKQQIEALKLELFQEKNRLRSAYNQLESYQKEARRRYEYEQDYLPYEDDDRYGGRDYSGW